MKHRIKQITLQNALLALHDAGIQPTAVASAIELGIANAKAEYTKREHVLAKAGLPTSTVFGYQVELISETAVRKECSVHDREATWPGSISDEERTELIKSTSLSLDIIDRMSTRETKSRKETKSIQDIMELLKKMGLAIPNGFKI